MQEYAPSPQFMRRIVYIVAVIGLVYFGIRMYPTVVEKVKTIQTGTAEKPIRESQTGIALADTDGDRLYDWEEALIGTDPQKSDTDGDGVSDYDQNRSELSREANSEQQNPGTQSNYTESLAHDLYTSIVLTEQQQGSVSDQQKADLANIALQGIDSITPPVYSALDLRSVPDSRDARIRFAASLVAVRKQYPFTYSDVPAMLSMIEDGRPIPPEIIARAQSSRTAVPVLLQLSIPQPFVQVYLDYVNAVAGYTYAVAALANSDTDPAPAFQMVKIMPSIVTDLDTSSTTIDKALSIQSANQQSVKKP